MFHRKTTQRYASRSRLSDRIRERWHGLILGCALPAKKQSWPPTLPVEKLPIMSEDDVVLVQVAWRRMEKEDKLNDVVLNAFIGLFKEHPSALKVFVRVRKKVCDCHTSSKEHSSLSLAGAKLLCNSKIKPKVKKVDSSVQTTISQTPASRQHLFTPDIYQAVEFENLPGKFAVLPTKSLSVEYNNKLVQTIISQTNYIKNQLINAEYAGASVDPEPESPDSFNTFQWRPNCMFQIKLDEDCKLGNDPLHDFLEHQDISWLKNHFNRMAMVLHHIVYILHEPSSAQKWLVALRLGHASLPGIQTVYYQCVMVLLEKEIAVSLGERFYDRHTKKAMRKFITVLFSYLADVSHPSISFSNSIDARSSFISYESDQFFIQQ